MKEFRGKSMMVCYIKEIGLVIFVLFHTCISVWCEMNCVFRISHTLRKGTSQPRISHYWHPRKGDITTRDQPLFTATLEELGQGFPSSVLGTLRDAHFVFCPSWISCVVRSKSKTCTPWGPEDRVWETHPPYPSTHTNPYYTHTLHPPTQHPPPHTPTLPTHTTNSTGESVSYRCEPGRSFPPTSFQHHSMRRCTASGACLGFSSLRPAFRASTTSPLDRFS